MLPVTFWIQQCIFVFQLNGFFVFELGQTFTYLKQHRLREAQRDEMLMFSTRLYSQTLIKHKSYKTH